MIIVFTVGFAFTFEKVLSSKFHVAMIAGEMFRMESLAQSSDNLSNNRLITSEAKPFLGCFHALLLHIFLQISKHVVKVGCNRFLFLIFDLLECIE